MSTNRNRARLNKAEDNHQYHVVWLTENYPSYWDEGLYFYPEYRKGYKNPKRFIMSYQVRMYRTWKHNRKTQWKE